MGHIQEPLGVVVGVHGATKRVESESQWAERGGIARQQRAVEVEERDGWAVSHAPTRSAVIRPRHCRAGAA